MATITWTGAAGDGNYNNPANWSPMQVPGAGDTAAISTAAATAIGITGSDAIAGLTTNKNVTLNLSNNGTYTIGSGTAAATFSNGGTFSLNSNYNNTDLVVGGAKLTLTGGGTILLNNYSQDRIYGVVGTDVLVNSNNLIEGGGQLGAGQLTFTNGAAGTVNANDGTQLLLNTGTVTVTNSGLLEATTGSAGLVIQSSINNGTAGRITAAGGTVFLSNGASISGGTLSSSGGASIQDSNTATLNGATNAVTNLGSIALVNNTTLTLLGSLVNKGTVALESNYNNTDLVIGSANVTLSGGGTIAMGDYPANRIYGTVAGDTLTNVDNTIAGAGQLGIGQLSLVNDATIDATGGNVLYLNTSTPTINNALIESTGVGGLVIQSAVDSHGGGTILAAGSTVSLSGATLEGGLVASSTVGTVVGAVVDTNGATLDGSAHTLTNTGLIDVNDNQALTLVGTITNHGSIALNSGYNTTYIYVASDVVVNGAGTIVLGDYNNQNQIRGNGAAGSIFDNINNKIVGAGAIGPNLGSFINEASGLVNANASDNSIIIDAAAVTNLGLMEATGAGGLSLQTTISNAGGTILAAGGNVYLDGATIAGGLVTNTGTTTLVVNASSTLDGSASTVTNAGTINVNDNQNLDFIGTLTNTGTIALNSNYNDTNLIANTAGTATLTGGGAILLGNYGIQNRIYGAVSGTVLNNVNNTISGAGQIGAGQLTFNNEAAGIVDANFSGNQIVLNSASAMTNAGLIEATAGGTLTLQTVLADGASGRLLGNGGVINLNGGTVQGGTISTINGGSVVDTTGGTLDGSANTVLSSALIDVNDNQSLDLLGTISNAGTIALNSGYNTTNLIASSPTVTLTGGGTILLGNYGIQNRIYGVSSANVLNNVNNTISGAGQIGVGQLTFNNEKLGVVNADFSGNQIVLNSASTMTNAGLIEATGGGTITLQTTLDSSGGGTLSGNGGVINLNGGTVSGGLLATSNGGSVIVSTASVLDGSTHLLTSHASIGINDNQSLYLQGNIANDGSISVNSGYNTTNLIVNSPTVTLTGTGTITLGDYGEQDRFYGAAAADVLDNVSNTINGGGQLGAGQLTLVNAGTIAATGTNALTVNLGSTGVNTATGQMLGEGAGGLVFQNGTYTNSGLIQADSGSSVTFQPGAVLTNDSATGTLTGGTYGAVSAGGTATASFGNAVVTTLDAALILSGAGSAISFGGVAIETSLKTIGAKGSLSILNNRGYTTKTHITNSGIITLGGGTFKDGAVTNKGTISGFGTLAAKLTDTGSVVATGGELTLSGATNSIAGTLSGTGTLAFSHGTTTLNAGTVLDVGNIALISAATLDLGTSVSFGGTFDVAGNATLAGPGSFTNTGLFEQTGHGLGSISAPFTNSGTVSIGSGGTLAFTGGLANTGTILDNGVFTDNAVLTGGNLTVGGAGSSATLGTGNSIVNTLTVGGGTLVTGGTLTVTGDYNNTAAGVGNSYMPFAGVTGTIDGQGTQLMVVGVNGTTITSVNGTLTITVAAHGTASFVIENTGAAGSAALRGALETTVNGGTINGTALSGSGVTAQDFGPIAAGSASGTFTVKYNGGALNNEAIHLQSDFANVAGVTIDIVKQAAAAAAPASIRLPHEHAAAASWVPAFHHL